MVTILVVDGSEEGPAAEECCRRLQIAGALTWTPARGLDPALDRDAAIHNGLDKCDVLLLVSDGGQVAPSAMTAVDLALSRNMPCYLSAPASVAVDSQLARRHWESVFDVADDDLAPFVASIGKHRSTPQVVEQLPDATLEAVPPITSNYVRSRDQVSPLPTFKPLDGPAAWAIGMVAAGTVLGALEAVCGYRQVMTLFGGGSAAISKAAALSDAFDPASILNLFLMILGAVTVLIWMSRGIWNLAAIGIKDYPYKAGFAVGSFFIPLVNLYVPYKAMAALARGSMPPLNPDDPDSWKLNRAPIASVLWTISWLSANILSTMQGRVSMASDASGEQKSWANAYLMLGDGAVTTIAGICLCLLISQVTRWQRDRSGFLPQESPIDKFARSKPSPDLAPALAVSGLIILGSLVFGLRGAAVDADKADPWFLQSVPGTPFSARLPQSVQPEIDHESGVTVDDWIAQRGADTFSILDYQLPAGTDTPIDPDDLKDTIKEIGQNMGTPTGEATGISLDSLKGAELTVNVTNPLMPAGTQGFLRGFASGSHIVVFLCILTGGDASEPAKEMFFGSISYRGVGTAPTQK